MFQEKKSFIYVDRVLTSQNWTDSGNLSPKISSRVTLVIKVGSRENFVDVGTLFQQVVEIVKCLVGQKAIFFDCAHQIGSIRHSRVFRASCRDVCCFSDKLRKRKPNSRRDRRVVTQENKESWSDYQLQRQRRCVAALNRYSLLPIARRPNQMTCEEIKTCSSN